MVGKIRGNWDCRSLLKLLGPLNIVATLMFWVKIFGMDVRIILVPQLTSWDKPFGHRRAKSAENW